MFGLFKRWARKNIAYVPQESFLFRGTIRDNLIYSNPTKIKLEQELSEIGVLGWFERYENGLDQEVGERGSNVSAGERQFIALLRAVLAKREIIVFDEATANLDIESENSILDATDTLLAPSLANSLRLCMSEVILATRTPVLFFSK